MTKHNSKVANLWKTTVLILAVLVPFNLMAQQPTGKILGTATDPAGAVVPGATVTVTNTATRVSTQTQTDKDGNFQVLALPIGNYQVAAEKEGFAKALTEARTLEINQSVRMDIKLKLGSRTETITVESRASGVETVNPTLGQSITVNSLVGLPLNVRNPYDLALLLPGVTEANPNSGSTQQSTVGNFSVAGGRPDSVTFLLDGGVNNNLLNNGVVFSPNPDTLGEFRVLTSNYTAEYGRNGAGVISAVTKSGTNTLHGSVFEFLRNDIFNANSYFNNRNKIPKEILKRNQFGFTVGGPVTIPHVVDGRDKLFFFASYAGRRQVKKETTPSFAIYTPAELSGDFSKSNTSRTGPDSRVVSFLQKFPFFQPNATLASQGIIDPTKFNSVVKKYISNNLIPTAPTGQLVSQGSSTDNSNDLSLKIDANISPKDKLAVTLGSSRNPTLTPFSGGSNVAGYGITGQVNRYFSAISYTRTLSPTLLNEFRFTAQRRNQLQAVPERKTPTPAELGIGVTPDNPTGVTRLVFNDQGGGTTIGFSPQGPTNLIDNTFAYTDTFSWIKGKHTWKFGGTYSPYQNNTLFDFFVDGEFDFNGTSGGLVGSGNDFADFLFGLPDSYLQFGAAPSNIRSKSTYAFAQDEWHVRRNLVLTLGIRYEYSSPKLDTAGRSFSVELGQKSQVFTNAPIGMVFPGDPAAPKGANFPDKNDWAPRFGFAWDPWSDGKTSIRGGFGIFYDILKGEDNLQFNGQAPFFGFSDLTFNVLKTNPTTEVNYMTQPYVATGVPNSFPSKPPPKNLDFDAAGFLPIGGSGVFFVDPHLRTPYTYHYNLSFQHEFVKNLTTELSYVGNNSHKLTDLVDVNPFVLGTLHRVFNTQPGANDGSFSFLDEFVNVVNANYNSLELLVNKQASEIPVFGTAYFTFSYTYGHGTDNGSGFRQRSSRVPFYQPKLFRASSDQDVTHRVAFGAGWDLPFSAGPRPLVKGWSLFPIFTYRSGFPLDVFAGFARRASRPGPSGAGDSNLVRADLVGNTVVISDPRAKADPKSGGGIYFLPANFTRTALGATCTPCATNPAIRTYGTLPRNFFRGPTRTNVNFAIQKTTPIIRERLNTVFRAEFLNIFNHALFNNPDTSFTSSTFGEITTTANTLDQAPGNRIMQFALKFTF